MSGWATLTPGPCTMGAMRAPSPGQALALLLLFVGGVLAPSLFWLPGDADDLILLSAAAAEPNPGRFFVGDWGLGNQAWRPLHSLTVWVSWRAFGAWALPGQALNIVLPPQVTVISLLRGLNNDYTTGKRSLLVEDVDHPVCEGAKEIASAKLQDFLWPTMVHLSTLPV